MFGWPATWTLVGDDAAVLDQLATPHTPRLGTLERADDTPETMFKRADNALYAAKRRGRNRVAADAA